MNVAKFNQIDRLIKWYTREFNFNIIQIGAVFWTDTLRINAEKQNKKLVASFIKNKNNTDEFFRICIELCAKKGYFTTILWLARNGICVEYAKDPFCIKYLNIVKEANFEDPIKDNIEKGNLENVKFLISNTKVVFDKYVELSCEYNKLEIVKYFVELGADVNYNSGNCLLLATNNENYEIIQFLLDKGCNIHANWENALITNIKKGKLDMVKFLVEKGATVDCVHLNILKYAAYYGHLNTLKFLLEKTTTDNIQHNIQTLNDAISQGHYDIVKLLLEKTNIGDINDNNKGFYFINTCCRKGYFNILKLLIEYGSNVEEVNNDTFLYVCSNGYFDIFKCLIENGAKMEINYRNGNRDFKYTIEKGYFEMMKYMIENIPEVVDDDINFHLGYAANRGYTNIVRYLLQLEQTDINSVHSSGKTVLSMAIAGSQLEMVKFLVEQGVYIDLQSLILASKHNNIEYLIYLLRRGFFVKNNFLNSKFDYIFRVNERFYERILEKVLKT